VNLKEYTGETQKIRISFKSSFILVIQLKGETNILYRLITHKVRYFEPLCVIILITAYENPKFKIRIL